jgi:hypothetical protein
MSSILGRYFGEPCYRECKEFESAARQYEIDERNKGTETNVRERYTKIVLKSANNFIHPTQDTMKNKLYLSCGVFIR